MNLGLRPCLVPNLTEFSYNYIIYSKNTIKKKNKASLIPRDPFKCY